MTLLTLIFANIRRESYKSLLFKNMCPERDLQWNSFKNGAHHLSKVVCRSFRVLKSYALDQNFYLIISLHRLCILTNLVEVYRSYKGLYCLPIVFSTVYLSLQCKRFRKLFYDAYKFKLHLLYFWIWKESWKDN